MTAPAVYIFRGAPASGKSTLLPKFCQLLPGPVALIEQDQFRWGLHLIGRDIPDVDDGEHAFAHQNTLLIYEQYLKHGRYTIAIEGLFTWDDTTSSQGNAKELIALAQSYDRPCKSIVLRADKEELLDRNAKRPYSVPRGEYETLYTNIYKGIGDSELVINSSHQSVDQTLEQLRQIIS
jgi:predicted kinase